MPSEHEISNGTKITKIYQRIPKPKLKLMRLIITRKTMFSLIVSLLASAYVFAQTQEVTIKGKLTDEQSGEAIAGAIVFVKGTKTAVQTDADGNFELKTTQVLPFTLSVSYIGYQPKEIEVYEEDQAVEFKIRSSSALSEVVVVGYGEQKRSDITGSIGSVAPELKTQPVASLDRLLQGAVAGVQVTQASGQPGVGSSIQIRGFGSITAGTEPLYVIDGFPIYNDQTANNAGNTGNGGVTSNVGQTAGTAPALNPLSSINTSDIESIDVLKDASATAIYGSRGANGVIVVTTKKGRAGAKAKISYDGYYGVQAPTNTIPLLNSSQFLALRANSLQNSYATGYVDPILSQLNPNVNTNWEKAIINPIHDASIQSHNLSITAGDEKTRVAFSGNYFGQNGVLINTPFQRFSGRLNLDHDFNSNLNVSTYLTFSQSNTQVAPSGVVQAALLMSPVIPIKAANGSYTLNSSPFTGTQYGNPVNSLLNDINQSNTSLFLGNVGGEYKLGKFLGDILGQPRLNGLTAKVLLGSNVTQNTANQYLPSTVYEGAPGNGVATIGNVFTSNWLNENTLNYTTKVNKVHAISGLVGYTQQASNTNGSVVSSQGFPTDATTFNSLGSGAVQNPSSSYQNAWALQSYLARVNYGYNDKYLLTVTVREDGSSKFAPGHKWGTFPSAAVAWNAGNEKFIKQIKQISQLKLRFSAGITGNQQIPPYSSLSQSGTFRYNLGGTNIIGQSPNSFNNPNLTWETTDQYDLGLDIGLFNNRITFTGDIYYKLTNNLLLNETLPADAGNFNFSVAQGINQAYINGGSLQNKGIELALQSKNLVGNFKWNTSVVYSHNDNRVLSLAGGAQQFIPNSSLPSVIQVGDAVGSFIVYKTDGLVAPGTLKANALTPNAQVDPNNTTLALAGQQKYADLNGDGKITAADREVINNQPIFIAGITNTFSYKGFDLTIFFQGSYGNKIFNQNQSLLDLGTGYTNASTSVLNRYTSTNTNTSEHAVYNNPAAILSDKYIEDGSYIRLKNITLGYSLPQKWLSKTKVISNVRIYVSSQNALTFTKYTGFDPEVSANGQTPYSQGVDYGAYPNAKSFLVGLNVTF